MCLPQIYILKPNHQCGIWWRGIWTGNLVLRVKTSWTGLLPLQKEFSEGSCASSTMWGYSEKMVINEDKGFQQTTNLSAPSLWTLQHPKLRNKFVVYKPSNLGQFCYSSMNGLRQSCISCIWQCKAELFSLLQTQSLKQGSAFGFSQIGTAQRSEAILFGGVGPKKREGEGGIINQPLRYWLS